MRVALYKGTRPGLQGIYSLLVRFIDRGPYSHCELVFSDGVSASSSYIDNGVRFKVIDYNPAHWDFIELPDSLEANARQWFREHDGEPYDLWGNVRFAFGLARDSEGKSFCSEALMSSIGFSDAYRYGPSGMVSALNYYFTQAE